MKSKILIIGASGMIGNSLLKFFLSKNNFYVFATVKSSIPLGVLNNSNNCQLFTNVDVDKRNDLSNIFNQVIHVLVVHFDLGIHAPFF